MIEVCACVWIVLVKNNESHQPLPFNSKMFDSWKNQPRSLTDEVLKGSLLGRGSFGEFGRLEEWLLFRLFKLPIPVILDGAGLGDLYSLER